MPPEKPLAMPVQALSHWSRAEERAPAASDPYRAPWLARSFVFAGAAALTIGLLAGRLGPRRPVLRAFLGTGVLGGFTTYSAFVLQTVQTFTAAPLVGIALAIVSVIGGVAAAGLGLRIAQGRKVPS